MYKGEALGLPLKYDNAYWIKQNRFVLENVGNEKLACSNYVGEMIHCLTSKPLNETVKCTGFKMPWPINHDYN